MNPKETTALAAVLNTAASCIWTLNIVIGCYLGSWPFAFMSLGFAILYGALAFEGIKRSKS